jgi:hypothetical protein
LGNEDHYRYGSAIGSNLHDLSGMSPRPQKAEGTRLLVLEEN